MNALEIIVAVIAAVFVGMGLCGLGVFCYFMLQGMKQLQQSAEKVVAAVAVVGKMEAMAERNFGEGSPTARAAKAVGRLADNVPQIVGGMDAFSKTMSVFYKMAFDEKAVERVVPGVATAPPADDSEFIPYSEERAAQFEVERAAKSQRLDLSREELATMRTEAPKPEPEPEPEPSST